MSIDELKEMHWMAAMISNIDVGMVVLDLDCEILHWNSFMEHHSNKSAEDVIGSNLFTLFPEIPQEWFQKKIETVLLLNSKAFTTWEQRPYIFKFKSYLPITGIHKTMFQNMTIIPLKSLSGEITQVTLIIYDVSDVASNRLALLEVNQQLEASNRIDQLTQVYNRGYLEECINREFNRCMRSEKASCLVMLDIDGLNNVNDCYGHPAGDEALRSIGKIITSVQRNTDISGRYDGGKFAIVLVDTNTEQAVYFMERLIKAINRTAVAYKNDNIAITASLGMAETEPEMIDYNEWLSRSEKALYNAKEKGRNQYQTYSPSE